MLLWLILYNAVEKKERQTCLKMFHKMLFLQKIVYKCVHEPVYRRIN